MNKYVEPKGYITPSMKKILDGGKSVKVGTAGTKPSVAKGSTKPAIKKSK